jgi:hypothetical protein
MNTGKATFRIDGITYFQWPCYTRIRDGSFYIIFKGERRSIAFVNYHGGAILL